MFKSLNFQKFRLSTRKCGVTIEVHANPSIIVVEQKNVNKYFRCNMNFPKKERKKRNEYMKGNMHFHGRYHFIHKKNKIFSPSLNETI